MNPNPTPANNPCGTPSADRVIPSGSLALDRALGGGWPRGRVVELYGPESGGKTTLALEAIAQAQRSGTGALVDADHATEPDAAKRLGVDPRGLVYHRGNVLEDVIPLVEQFVKRDIDVIVIDSIAALMTKYHSRGDDFPPAKNETHQRAIEHWLKTLLAPLSKSRSVLIFTNQVREKIGVMYGDPTTTPWETLPLRDFASVRAEVKRVTHIKDGENVIGYEGRVRVMKNRFAPPYQNVELQVHYNRGVVIEHELVTLGLERDVLTQSGQYIRFGETVIGRNRTDAIRRLERDAALTDRLEEAVVASLRNNAVFTEADTADGTAG